MKKVLIKIGIRVVLVGVLILFFYLWQKERNERKRIQENFDIEITNERERQQTLTTKEFKKYFDEYVAELKNYGIKPNQVENVVSVRYVYKDTLIQKQVLNFRDTLIQVYDTAFTVSFSDFDIESNCNRVTGKIIADTLIIDSIETTDNLLISLYKEKRKCLLKKRSIKAIAISECKKDTLTILHNLKIGKK
jgi:hypothetical protein